MNSERVAKLAEYLYMTPQRLDFDAMQYGIVDVNEPHKSIHGGVQLTAKEAQAILNELGDEASYYKVAKIDSWGRVIE